MNDKMIKW